MIKTKINLLKYLTNSVPPKMRSTSYKPSLFVFLFAFILLGFEIAFLITFYRNISHQIISSEKYEVELAHEILETKRGLTQLKEQDKMSPITKTSSFADRLKKDNQNVINILEVFNKTLPSHAWISHLSQRENRFIIDGYALNNEIISIFLIELQKSNHFSDIKLVKAEQLMGDQRNIKKFSIACETDQI